MELGCRTPFGLSAQIAARAHCYPALLSFPRAPPSSSPSFCANTSTASSGRSAGGALLPHTPYVQ
eukprot:366014-Chlamydomonas_euryale.AAC.10